MPRDSEVDTSVERADPLVGTIFDRRFRVEERIATGGFGAIYRATHVKSSHPVALKVLLPALAQDLGVVARFRREGDTLTSLRNPHTITAYELGQAADHTLFITMELLHGESLFERYQARGPFEWKRMLRIARQVCESLEEAHALGIVHRDLKPTNIHLEARGDDTDFVKVLDFGIAKIIGGSDLPAADLTNAGQMVGTLDYMSPEQMVGGMITGQTDLYTLGIVMYEMIAGATPFPAAMTAAQALASAMRLTPEPLSRRVPVPEELDRIVARCLERETDHRYKTVAELRADLDRLLAGTAPDRAAGLDTKPIVRHDDEATMFTPPPELLVAASRRARRPSGEDTSFTPPPEPLLAASRDGGEWSRNEATTAASPSAQLLAASRRTRRPSGEQTTFTPPPEPLLAASRRAKPPSGEQTELTPPPAQVLADLRTAPRPRQDPETEWTDDDEFAPTARRRRQADTARQGGEEHERVTKVAHLSEIVERAAMTRGDAIARGGEASPARRPAPAPGVPDARGRSRTAQPPSTLTPPRAATPHGGSPAVPRTLSPQQVVPPAVPRTLSPQQVVPPAMPRTLSPQQVVPPAMPRTLSPQQVVPPSMPRTMTPQHVGPPAVPRTMTPHDMPPIVAAPFSVTAPGAAPPISGYPSAQAYPQYPSQHPPAAGFDMGRMAAREATIRRVIWIAVLVLAIVTGVVLAVRLG